MRFDRRWKIWRSAAVLAAAAWMAGCSLAGNPTGVAALPESTVEPLFPHERSDLEPDPQVRFGRLENGFRYVLLENSEPRDRVSMHLNVQAGSLQETEDQRGLAHFLEHMLFNGTEHFPPGELVKYFQRIGMNFGPDINAHTGFQETVYDILLPDGKRDSVAEGLLVMKDYAAGALLLEEEVQKERGVILAEKQARDSAGYRTFESSFRFEMADTRLARRLPIGTEEAIRAADRAQLKDFYDTWYRPDTMILVMVGDFDAETTEAMVKARFADLRPRAPIRETPPLGMLDHQGIKPFYHLEKEIGKTTVSIEVLESIPRQDDSLELQKKELLSRVAHRIVQNRLDRMLQDADTPFTSAYISTGRFLGEIAYAEISAEGPPDTWRQRLLTLEQTLRQTIEYGFGEDELERVQKEMIAELDSEARKASTRGSQKLARQIIRKLNDNRVFQSPVQEKEQFEPFLAGLTPARVHRAFQAAWDRGHRLVLVTGNAQISGDSAAAEQEILAAYKESRTIAVSPPSEGRVVAFPFFPVPEAAAPIGERRNIDDLGIVQVDFANGVRLNFKRTDFKADEVDMRLAFGYGTADEPVDRPGLSEVSQGVVNESGMGPLTKDALKRALAGSTTDFDFQVKEDHHRFAGTTVPDELELAFQMLRGYLVAPAFRQDALELTLRRLAQRYERFSRSIEGQMKIEGDRFLAGGDSRFGEAVPSSLERISLEDVRSWLQPAFSRARLEVSVIGDVDVEEVISLAARYLGTLPPRQGIERRERQRPTFPAGAAKTLPVETEIVKSLVVVAWPTDDFWDIERTRRLSVLGSVFSEKLRERIREKLGVAYSPYAYSDPSRAYQGYGRLMSVVPTDPGEVQTVLSEVRKIADTLSQTQLTEDEVKRVMEPILTGLKDLRRTNGYWIDSVMSGSARHPRQLEWARSIVEDYNRIGADDIRQMARTYLDNRRSAALVIRPAR
jgi:zinc protease